MGSWFSSPSPFITDPSLYATKVDDKAVPSNIRTYDYIIVGGGESILFFQVCLEATMQPRHEMFMFEIYSFSWLCRHGGMCVSPSTERRFKHQRAHDRSWEEVGKSPFS